MRSLTEQIARKCVHFSGISEKQCKVGVAYETVRDSTTSPYNFACFKENVYIPCEQRCFPTDKAVAAEVAAIEEHSTRTIKAMFAARQDADVKGFGKGSGGFGEINCPCCIGGTLRYSVAAYNGHMHGQCTTPDCVSWM